MERELIIPVKDANFDKRKMDNTIKFMQSQLPMIESVNTFIQCHDVFDTAKRKVAKKKTIIDAFETGVDSVTNLLCFNRN